MLSHLNGSTNGAAAHDADLDLLYAWMPPQPPAPAPLPEAALSLTLKGTLSGVEAMLTIRGQSAAEFHANLAAVRGLLDPVQPAQPLGQSGQGEGWCSLHNVAMKQTVKEGRSWYFHRIDGAWCKGK
jgi:hypothetical protein